MYKLTVDQYYFIVLNLKPGGKRPLGRPRRRWTMLKWILER
jgi:hypothetical protein